MHQTKAVLLLSRFSLKDKRRFRKFLASPFFNESSLIIQLYSFVEGFHHSVYKDDELTYENAFADLFPGEDYSKDSITKLLSKMYQLMQSFLVHNKVDHTSFSGKIELLDYYNQQALPTLFNSVQKEAEKIRQSESRQDIDFLYLNYLYETQVAGHMSTRGDRKGDLNFQEMNTALDKFFIVGKLVQLCHMINREKIINYTYDKVLMKELTDHLKTSPYKSDPLIEVWSTALNLLLSPTSKKEYVKLKQLKNQHQMFSEVDARILYTFLENATRNIFTDASERFHEVLDLYKIQLESGIMHINGYLHKNVLKNIVTVAIHCDQLEWAEGILKELKSADGIRILPIGDSETVYNYNLSYIYFRKREFEEARQLLYIGEYKDVFYKTDAYVLLLRIRYETRDFYEIESLINKFRVFIHRAKDLIADRKEIYRQFINAYEALYKIQMEADESKHTKLVAKLQSKLESTDRVHERLWFEEKLREF